MTPNQWKGLTRKEKAEYVLNSSVKLEQRTGMRADAKVGEDNAFVVHYAVKSGEVHLSNWHATKSAALREASETLQTFEQGTTNA